jgi:hypothetical protein
MLVRWNGRAGVSATSLSLCAGPHLFDYQHVPRSNQRDLAHLRLGGWPRSHGSTANEVRLYTVSPLSLTTTKVLMATDCSVSFRFLDLF